MSTRPICLGWCSISTCPIRILPVKVYDTITMKYQMIWMRLWAYEEVMDSEDTDDPGRVKGNPYIIHLDPDMTYMQHPEGLRKTALTGRSCRRRLTGSRSRINCSMICLRMSTCIPPNRLGTGDQKQSATIAEVIKVLDGCGSDSC